MGDNIVDFGPLAGLIGVWTGDKGMDVAPEPDGTEHNPYFETLTFAPVGDVTNAEAQTLSVLHYRQIVQKQFNGDVFHDETGYWMWDPETDIVMHSLLIPRGVAVLAGGTAKVAADGTVTFDVAAGVDNAEWGIIQSPFMQEKARTTAFSHTITLGSDTLSYAETTMLDIYGKAFEHTDGNELVRQ